MLSLFNGLNLNHKIKYAELVVKNSTLNTQWIQQNAEAEFEQLFQQYAAAKNIITLQKKFIETAQYNLDLSKQQLALGLISAIEYRLAQESFLTASNSLNSALSTADKAAFAILKMSGELTALVK